MRWSAFYPNTHARVGSYPQESFSPYRHKGERAVPELCCGGRVGSWWFGTTPEFRSCRSLFFSH